MGTGIEFNFYKRINGYAVAMQDFVMLDMIEEWKSRFDQNVIAIQSSIRSALILDTNMRNFESIQCLKILREYLIDIKALKSKFSMTALIPPENLWRLLSNQRLKRILII